MENAILVQANLTDSKINDYYLQELESLASACNLNVQYSMTQNIKHISSTYYIGSGKVKEIKSFVEQLDATIVVFNNELSGSQVKNLENEIGCRVIDRTILILDIFATRAKTKVSMLQVEIAQLDYLLPRLSGMGASLNRQQGGIGSRGPGEKKLELDRRRIVSEKAKLQKQLDDLLVARTLQRKTRSKSNIKKVALVGYTNSGKSTLLNKLTSFSNDDPKVVLSKDMLFATLETATRQIKLQNNKEFIVTDTVGFVSNLPHKLVESFKSTLEEIKEADFLIHVVDSSHPFYEKQIQVTEDTLKEIGVKDKKTLYLYNKNDLITDKIDMLHFPNLSVSLNNDNDIHKIIITTEELLFDDYEIHSLLIPYTDGSLLHYFKENNSVISLSHEETGTLISLELSKLQVQKYAKYIKENN